MCRLLGVIADGPVDMQFSLLDAPRTFTSLGDDRNPDGWGMGWYQPDGTPGLFREALPASKSGKLPRLAATTLSRIFACHVRKSSCGDAQVLNCHPFAWERWLFAHNGTLDRAGLWERLDEKHRAAVRGETDSEVFFHWIIQCIEKAGGDVDAGVTEALQSSRDYTGLNFVLSDGKALYAYRGASMRFDHYSLYYQERRPGDAGELLGEGCEAAVSSSRLPGRRAVLVCSEPLTGDEWREVPLGHLLTVEEGMGLRLTCIGCGAGLALTDRELQCS